LPATVNLSLPNVINIDSDGSAIETPAMVGFTAQTCVSYQILSDWLSGATGTSINYIGYSETGTPTSANTWNITKININISGTTTSGSTIGPWDDRYILIYT
jgi:hypothetical protein